MAAQPAAEEAYEWQLQRDIEAGEYRVQVELWSPQQLQQAVQAVNTRGKHAAPENILSAKCKCWSKWFRCLSVSLSLCLCLCLSVADCFSLSLSSIPALDKDVGRGPATESAGALADCAEAVPPADGCEHGAE